MKIAASVALITGANRGLGQAHMRELVSRGAAKVYGAARQPGQVTEPGCWPMWTPKGGQLEWPVAVLAESPDEMSVVFRTYCSQWPVDEQRHVRPPVLKPGPAHPGDVVGRYQAALSAGDTEDPPSVADPATREDTPMEATYRPASEPAGRG